MSGPDYGRLIATVGGIGRLRPAPGTWGSAAALPVAWAILHGFGTAGLLAAIAGVSWLGAWAASDHERSSGTHDPAEVVIDEVAGQWIALLPVGYYGLGWAGWLAAFALFRLFDIWKPGPIGQLDRQFKGGVGTMIDDTAAGLCAAGILCAPIWTGLL